MPFSWLTFYLQSYSEKNENEMNVKKCHKKEEKRKAIAKESYASGERIYSGIHTKLLFWIAYHRSSYVCLHAIYWLTMRQSPFMVISMNGNDCVGYYSN